MSSSSSPRPHQIEGDSAGGASGIPFKYVALLVGGAVLLICLAFIAGQPTPVDRAKMFFVEMATVITLICAVVAIFSARIFAELKDLEAMAYFLQNEAMLNLTAARMGLEDLDERLHGESSQQMPGLPPFITPQLLKQLGPLVMMVVNKEKSVMQWGIMGFKLASNAWSAYKQSKKQ